MDRILKRFLGGGLWGLVLSLGSLTAYGQVHVVHHTVHVVPHSVVVHGRCCPYYRSYRYHPYHVYHSYPVHHVYHQYHVYHEYQVHHEYQVCCPHQESYDHLAHKREAGYHDGFDRGKDDASDARSLDPYHSHRYRESRSVAYREGFVQGYEAGYHDYTH